MTMKKMPLKEILCLKCMECCKLTVIPTAYDEHNHEAREFYEAKGFTVDVHNEKRLLYLIFPIHCASLTPFGCKIYDTRPKWCRIYDGRFDPFVKHCLWNDPKYNV